MRLDDFCSSNRRSSPQRYFVVIPDPSFSVHLKHRKPCRDILDLRSCISHLVGQKRSSHLLFVTKLWLSSFRYEQRHRAAVLRESGKWASPIVSQSWRSSSRVLVPGSAHLKRLTLVYRGRLPRRNDPLGKEMQSKVRTKRDGDVYRGLRSDSRIDIIDHYGM